MKKIILTTFIAFFILGFLPGKTSAIDAMPYIKPDISTIQPNIDSFKKQFGRDPVGGTGGPEFTMYQADPQQYIKDFNTLYKPDAENNNTENLTTEDIIKSITDLQDTRKFYKEFTRDPQTKAELAAYQNDPVAFKADFEALSILLGHRASAKEFADYANQKSANEAASNGCGVLSSNVDCYTPISPIKDAKGNPINTKDFPSYLDSLYRIGIGICFVLGVIMFTWAGIEYIISESFNSKGDAKKRMQSALIGLAIALVSYIILNTINPDLLKLQPIDINAGKAATTPTNNVTANTPAKTQ